MTARLICIFAAVLCLSNLAGCSTTRSSQTDEFRFQDTAPPPETPPPETQSLSRNFARDIPLHAGNALVVAAHMSTFILRYTVGLLAGAPIGPYDPPEFTNPWSDF